MGEKLDRRDCLKVGAMIGSGLALGSIAKAASAEEDLSNIFEVIQKRRSVRKFKSTPVPEEHLMKILQAANQAPSPRNRQAWKFLVIRDRKVLDEIKDACIQKAGEKSKTYYEDYLSAPVYVVILAEVKTQNPENDIIAGVLAAQNLFLAARSFGYGTVYCANSIPEDVLKQVLHIPDDYKRMCITPIGVPDEWPESPPKKDVKEFILYEKFS